MIVAASSEGIKIESIPAGVINNMIDQGVAIVKASQPEALSSSIGAIYARTKEMGGINALGVSPSVDRQTKIYVGKIQEDHYLCELKAIASRLATEDKPEFERAIALAAFGFTYSTLQKALVEADITNLKLFPTVQGTIEKNTEVTLDENQRECFGAAQLSIGLNLQTQYTIDPKTFATMFKPWMQNEADSVSSGWSLNPLSWFSR